MKLDEKEEEEVRESDTRTNGAKKRDDSEALVVFNGCTSIARRLPDGTERRCPCGAEMHASR